MASDDEVKLEMIEDEDDAGGRCQCNIVFNRGQLFKTLLA